MDFSLHKLVCLTTAQLGAPTFVYLQSDPEAGSVGVCGLQGIAFWFGLFKREKKKVLFFMSDRAEFP